MDQLNESFKIDFEDPALQREEESDEKETEENETEEKETAEEKGGDGRGEGDGRK